MTKLAHRRGHTALATALMVVAACQMAAPSPGGSLATFDPTATAPPTTSPTDRTPRRSMAVSWSRVEDFDFSDEVGGLYSMTSVASSAAGFVAVGQGPTSSIAWVSPDARQWDRADPDEGFGQDRVEQVVAVDGGFLAVGRSNQGAGVSWTSADGRAWDRPVTLPGLEEGLISHIAAGDDGVVAVGYPLGDPNAYQFWASADGRSWRTPTSAPIARVEPGIALALSDSGYLVIGSPVAAGISGMSLWTSVDGKSWTERATDLDPGLLPVAVARDSGGFVASFLDSDSAIVARSDDGESWQLRRRDSIDALVSLLVAIPGGYLAGSDGNDGPALWTSGDGVGWDPVEDLRPFARSHLRDVTVRGESIVAVGDTEMATDLISASVWVSHAVPSGAASPVIGPPCPGGSIVVNDLLVLDPTARLTCLGNRPITFLAYLPTPNDTCAGTGIEPYWLRGCDAGAVLLQGAPGNSAGLPARLHPSTELDLSTVPTSRWVRVTGHYDDPAATTCREVPQPGVLGEPREISVLECRKQFVITEIRPAETP